MGIQKNLSLRYHSHLSTGAILLSPDWVRPDPMSGHRLVRSSGSHSAAEPNPTAGGICQAGR